MKAWGWMIALGSLSTLSTVGKLYGQEELPPLRIESPTGVQEVPAAPPSALPAEIGDEPLAQEGEFETLTRGPLHEAFAETYSIDPAPSLLVPKEPPAMVDELPPEFRPDGDEMVWIPGYWGWDADRKDYIWISGVYRVPPEGQRWVPGYWQAADGGWQWIPGFWLEDAVETIEYLEPPPVSLEAGPTSPSPGPDYVYIPGYWHYAPTGYQWQVGYWYPGQMNYVWVPPRYIWTPAGCIFVNGYWDLRLAQRGYCFAPVYVNYSTYVRPRWRYRPMVMLNTNTIFHNLFVCPNYHHYMFGDYYASHYVSYNIQPVYTYHVRTHGIDPLMSFYSAYYARQGRDLGRWYQDYHRELRMDATKRPPSTWAQMKQLNDKPSHKDADWLADSIQNVVVSSNVKSKFIEDKGASLDRIRKVQLATNQIADERKKIEQLGRGKKPDVNILGNNPIDLQDQLSKNLNTKEARDLKNKSITNLKLPQLDDAVKSKVRKDGVTATGQAGRTPPPLPSAGNKLPDLRTGGNRIQGLPGSLNDSIQNGLNNNLNRRSNNSNLNRGTLGGANGVDGNTIKQLPGLGDTLGKGLPGQNPQGKGGQGSSGNAGGLGNKGLPGGLPGGNLDLDSLRSRRNPPAGGSLNPGGNLNPGGGLNPGGNLNPGGGLNPGGNSNPGNYPRNRGGNPLKGGKGATVEDNGSLPGTIPGSIPGNNGNPLGAGGGRGNLPGTLDRSGNALRDRIKSDIQKGANPNAGRSGLNDGLRNEGLKNGGAPIQGGLPSFRNESSKVPTGGVLNSGGGNPVGLGGNPLNGSALRNAQPKNEPRTNVENRGGTLPQREKGSKKEKDK